MDYSPEEEGIASGEFFMTSRSYDLFKASSGLERKSFICLALKTLQYQDRKILHWHCCLGYPHNRSYFLLQTFLS